MADTIYNEDEIDLVELFLLLWKKKILILSGMLIVIIVATIVSFSLPKVYQVQMKIHLRSDNNDEFYKAELDNMAYHIRTDMYYGRIVERLSDLGLKPIPSEIDCKVLFLGTIETFTIYFGVSVDDIEFGKKILKGIYPIIIQQINKLIEHSANEDKIKLQSEQIKLDENILDQRTKLSTLKIHEQRISFLDAMIATTKVNNAELKIKQKKLLPLSEKANTVNLISTLFYANTIQQNSYMINTLMNEINWIIQRKSTIKKELDFINSKVKENNRIVLMSEQSIKEKRKRADVSQPEYRDLPTNQYKKYIIGLSGLVGAFLMSLIVLLIEYVTKYQERKKLG